MNAREKRLRRQYYDFELYFNGITESDDADLFLWLNAAALVKASGCSRKNRHKKQAAVRPPVMR